MCKTSLSVCFRYVSLTMRHLLNSEKKFKHFLCRASCSSVVQENTRKNCKMELQSLRTANISSKKKKKVKNVPLDRSSLLTFLASQPRWRTSLLPAMPLHLTCSLTSARTLLVRLLAAACMRENQACVDWGSLHLSTTVCLASGECSSNCLTRNKHFFLGKKKKTKTLENTWV